MGKNIRKTSIDQASSRRKSSSKKQFRLKKLKKSTTQHLGVPQNFSQGKVLSQKAITRAQSLQPNSSLFSSRKQPKNESQVKDTNRKSISTISNKSKKSKKNLPESKIEVIISKSDILSDKRKLIEKLSRSLPGKKMQKIFKKILTEKELKKTRIRELRRIRASDHSPILKTIQLSGENEHRGLQQSEFLSNLKKNNSILKLKKASVTTQKLMLPLIVLNKDTEKAPKTLAHGGLKISDFLHKSNNKDQIRAESPRKNENEHKNTLFEDEDLKIGIRKLLFEMERRFKRNENKTFRLRTNNQILMDLATTFSHKNFKKPQKNAKKQSKLDKIKEAATKNISKPKTEFEIEEFYPKPKNKRFFTRPNSEKLRFSKSSIVKRARKASQCMEILNSKNYGYFKNFKTELRKIGRESKKRLKSELRKFEERKQKAIEELREQKRAAKQKKLEGFGESQLSIQGLFDVKEVLRDGPTPAEIQEVGMGFEEDNSVPDASSSVGSNPSILEDTGHLPESISSDTQLDLNVLLYASKNEPKNKDFNPKISIRVKNDKLLSNPLIRDSKATKKLLEEEETFFEPKKTQELQLKFDLDAELSPKTSSKSIVKSHSEVQVEGYHERKNPVRIHRKMVENNRKEFNQRKHLADNHRIRKIANEINLIIAKKERDLLGDPNDDFSDIVRPYTTTKVTKRVKRKRDMI